MLPEYNQTELSRAKKRKAQTDLLAAASTLASECEKPNTHHRYAFDAKLYACYFCKQRASPRRLGPSAML